MGRLSDVEIFVAVVEHGSFTAAARTLGISKSYASRRVSALEDRVGASLLTRNTRHVTPTGVGEAFHQRCHAALELLEDAEQIVARELDEPRGALKVSLPLSFGLRYLAPVVAAFAARWPDVRVHASYTDRKVDLVDEGYDLAVRIGTLADSELVARRLGTSEGWICASPAYLERKGTPSTPADLAQHDAVLYTLMPDPKRWRVPAAEGTAWITVDGRFLSDNGEALVAASCAGLGVAYHPDWLCADAVRDGRLVRLFPELPGVPQGVWAVWPRHRHLTPKVARFVDALAAALSPAPWTAPCVQDSPSR